MKVFSARLATLVPQSAHQCLHMQCCRVKKTLCISIRIYCFALIVHVEVHSEDKLTKFLDNTVMEAYRI